MNRVWSHIKENRKFDNIVHIACIVLIASNLVHKGLQERSFINNRIEEIDTLAHQKIMW